MAKQATQFCVGVENKPGTLAELCEFLSQAEINIEAVFISIDEKSSWVNLVADSPAATERALVDGGFHFYSEDVVTLRATNRPGELASVARKLADADININYVYGSTGEGASFSLVLHVSDLPGTMKLIGD